MDNTSIVAHQPATLVCIITNITMPPPQETKFGFTPPSVEDSFKSCTSVDIQKVGYEVQVDRKAWGIQGSGQGVFEMPASLKKARLQFQVVPTQSGVLQVPTVQLYKMTATDSSIAGEADKKLALTNAQVYDCSRGQLVTVHSDDSSSR